MTKALSNYPLRKQATDSSQPSDSARLDELNVFCRTIAGYQGFSHLQHLLAIVDPVLNANDSVACIAEARA